MNIARARDIELLTGLRLFTSIPESQRVVLITHLEQEFWKRPSWMDEPSCHIKQEGSCPDGYRMFTIYNGILGLFIGFSSEKAFKRLLLPHQKKYVYYY